MIRNKEGRSRSFRTRKELEDMLEKEMGTLSPEEREAVQIIIKEMEDEGKVQAEPKKEPKLLDILSGAEFKRPLVDVETFIKDPYYLGNTCDNLYPVLLEDLKTLFSGGYHEAVWTGSIGYGKCVLGDTEVYDASSGRRRRVDELGSYNVPSMTAAGKIVSRPAKAFPSGKKPCVKLALVAGQHLTLSTDHPVFTTRGWIKAAELQPGEFIATPRFVPEPKRHCEVSDDAVKLVAYLLADGGVTCNVSFTNANPDILEEFAGLVRTLGKVRNGQPPEAYPKKTQHSGKATTLNVRGISEFVERWELRDLSKEKRLPSEFYGLPREQVALLLNRFWACDGCVNVKGNRSIETTLASEGLIDDIRFLLLRLGITSRKYSQMKGYRLPSGERKMFPAWTLAVTGAPLILKFLDAVGPVFGKEAACAAMRDVCAGIVTNTNTDIVPVGYSELKEIREELGSKGAGLTAKFGCPEGQLFGRSRFERLCETYDYKGKYAWLASTDLFWERLASVEDVGVCDVYDLSVDETHSFVANGVVVHNTHVSTIGVLRVIYEISCMKDPHKSFGLAQGSNLSFVCTSVNETLAVKVVFEAIASKVKASPYFQENFPYEETKKEIRFPGGIWVAARASTDTSALGLNAIGALLDETNFLPKTQKEMALGAVDRAETIYNTIQRRMKSRFARYGKLPGMLFIVSSKKTMDDFTARRIRDAVNDPTVFVRDYALWDTKPDDYYSAKKFWVLGGTDSVPSKILTDPEYVELKERVPEGATLVHVPEDFRNDFERDLEGSLRDLAGVATVAINPFIHRREKILEAIDATRVHPFSTPIYDASKGGRFLWEMMVKAGQERGYSNTYSQVSRPILNPKAMRHVHIDPSLRGDATGFVMSHVGGYKDVARRGEDGREYSERAPIYFVDLMLRIVPPTGDEIVLADLRHLVYDLSAHGYMISGVTLDSWQSADTIQQFNQRGFQSQVLSVDTSTDPYENLKTALYENRVNYYNYPPLIEELQQLERKFDGRKTKIDHPPKGRKDVADALAASLYALSTKQTAQPLPVMRGLSYSGDAWLEEQRAAAYAGNKSASFNTDVLPAFIKGGGGGDDGGWNGGGGFGGGFGGGGWFPE